MKFFIKELEEGNRQVLLSGHLNSEIFSIARVFPDEIEVVMNTSRFNKNVSANLEIRATGHFQCDRCLANFTREFDERPSLFFRLTVGGEHSEIEEEEDVICLREDEKEYDLSDIIAEQLGLAIPIRSLCDDECKGLCSVCGVDLNKTKCDCARDSIDPRLDQLKNIKNNLEGK